MRIKKSQKQDITLRTAADEFLSYKKAQKIRERTLSDYETYLDKFIKASSNSLEMSVLKSDLLRYFAAIKSTSPAAFNHPYQHLHALFAWCVKQDYLPCNPFDKLDLKKRKDDGHILPAEIKEIQAFLQCLDKHNFCELRDYTITLLMLDTGIRTSEVMSLKDSDYNPDIPSIVIRPEVAKTNRGRTVYLSTMTNTVLKKFAKCKPREWAD